MLSNSFIIVLLLCCVTASYALLFNLLEVDILVVALLWALLHLLLGRALLLRCALSSICLCLHLSHEVLEGHPLLEAVC